MVADPLVVTLRLDRESFLRFDRERCRFFPAHLNRVPAHLSLFHRLPGDQKALIEETLAAAASGLETFAMSVSHVKNLGRGVAYVLGSPALVELRDRLANKFEGWLSPQDQQPYRPHITIQNKVDPEEARHTLTRLQSGFEPFTAAGTGLCLWRYLGGPWQLENNYPFGRDQAISVAGPMSP